jgi:hypothetical protein
LKQKLQTWFSPAFLDLERITWNTSASILEKIMEYEAVHAIDTWKHLKQRLGPGRLCFAFFHRGMPKIPLTFIQIALVDSISSNVQAILEDTKPERHNPRTAIFYSITSSQSGLAGIDLGNFLIKQVVTEIKKYAPTVSTFCTLSPIPGFSTWLKTQIEREELLSDDEVKQLEIHVEASSSKDLFKKCLDQFHKNEVLQEHMKPILMRLCER